MPLLVMCRLIFSIIIVLMRIILMMRMITTIIVKLTLFFGTREAAIVVVVTIHIVVSIVLIVVIVVFAARNQHLRNEILPRLTRGEWVVCDRFTDASYAYQGAARGVSNDVIGFLEECVQGELRPDLTVYLDLDPAIGRQRIADREQDRLEQEQLGFFEAVRSGYLARAASEPYFRTVDASGTVEQVRADMQLVINDFLDEVYAP